MKANSFTTAGQALRSCLESAGLSHLLLKVKLEEHWEEVMGERAAKMVSIISLQKGQLRLKVESSVWRQELHFQKVTIRDKANQILGSHSVREVILQ